MVTPGERLKFLRESLEMSLEKFGGRLQVSHTSVSRWESGSAEISFITALAIEKVYGASHSWLLLGMDPMWSKDVGAADGEAWARMEQFLVDRPLIVGAARCGPGGIVEDPGPGASRYALRRDFAARILAKSGGDEESDLYFLLCRGDSMRPTILDKEIVLINTALGARLEPRAGGIYLVKRSPEDEEARVKRIRLDAERGDLVLASDNRTFMTITVPLDAVPIHQLVLGRVVWVGRYLLETDPPEGDW